MISIILANTALGLLILLILAELTRQIITHKNFKNHVECLEKDFKLTMERLEKHQDEVRIKTALERELKSINQKDKASK